MSEHNKALEKRVRHQLAAELMRRHGYGMMGEKIKPVHLANALLRASHQRSGDLNDIQHLMTATAAGSTADEKRQAVERLIGGSRERWGRLGEPGNRDALQRRVLPLLRRLLASDGSANGATPGQSSFSVPTASLTTPDPSDEHAGEMVFRLWAGADVADMVLLPILRAVSDPTLAAERMDDLTAVLAPLSTEAKERRARTWAGEDLSRSSLSPIEELLRAAARDLERYERAASSSPIAALQRIILLASLTVFTHASTRAVERAGSTRVPLLIDASNHASSAIAEASTRLVARLLSDARRYMTLVLSEILSAEAPGDPVAERPASPFGAIHEVSEGSDTDEAQDGTEAATQLVALLKHTLPGYVRSLGWRSGLLYPVEKNPNKRVVPTDRTLEVLVLSTFDVTGRPLELSEFLDALYARWGLVTGGRTEDGAILDRAGVSVGSQELSDNGERFLSRLEAIGLAQRLADSVAMVGLGALGTGGEHAGD